MRINLLASTEAEKSSVMADTDEASQEFANQAMQASAVVEEARSEFARLMEGSKAGDEMNFFQEFSSCWEKLQEIDREVLSLAVQNTNLKALRLSFVPAREIIRRMEGALDQLMDATASSSEATGISRLAYEVISGTFKLYALQPPHIIETTPDKMDEIEAAMKDLDKQVESALKDLEIVIDKSGRASLEATKTAYEDFQRIHAEIIALSRRNTNVRSFAMSLGQRRNVTAQCQETLLALQQVIQSRKIEATR
jgi:dGTP triphosphohydrolase